MDYYYYYLILIIVHVVSYCLMMQQNLSYFYNDNSGNFIFLYVFFLTLAYLGHAMPVRSLCFSPDSQLLVTGSDDKDMKIYDVYVINIHNIH